MMPNFYIGNLYFVLELLIAELIFLYPTPKRSKFPLRFIGAISIAVLISCLFPSNINGIFPVLQLLLRSFCIFAFSVTAMLFCFRLPMWNLLSLCIAGYCVQHIAYRLSDILRQISILADVVPSMGHRRSLEILCMVIVYIFCFITYGRYSARHECWRNNDFRLNAITMLILFLCIVVSRTSRLFDNARPSISSSIYCIICCLLALFIQFHLHRMIIFNNERLVMERLWQEERKQYTISKNVIEDINIKVHDLRHKLTTYQRYLPQEEIDSLAHHIDIYDGAIHTGNEALDVLMTEKSHTCKQLGIHFSCLGPGKLLSFMRTMDIYSLFGNAVDNAIEAVEKLPEEKRFIELSIEQRGAFVFASVVNYFDGQLELRDGLPQTTKTDHPGYHGFGIKSMKRIAERYQGGVSVAVNDDCFFLNIYLKND